jgi:flagellar biosynthesis/type III secretory pathway M-ring protein FliF/YscJ
VQSAPKPRRPKKWLWVVLGAVVVVLVAVAILVVPILTHVDSGLANQRPSTEQWPSSASGRGDDGRERTLTVATADGSPLDTSALTAGQKLIVTGTGFNGKQGIYVAICAIPANASLKPGSCIGGVPDQQQQDVAAGAVQYAPSNWINDDWAWKLFGARSFDNIDAGTFTAYLEVGEPVTADLDCTTTACGIYSRNDHTALRDRSQDLYVPVGFATAP